MTMPSSGAINLGGTSSPISVAQELGLGLTSTISMNDAAVRTLAAVGGSGTSWSMNSLYGKANKWIATISTNQQEMNLATWASANGWNGSKPAEITIGSGVYIWSNNTATPALTTGSFPGGLTIINNGYIMGKGGGGGAVVPPYGTYIAATSGGNAISLSQSCSINNVGYIGGGGGGGAGVGEGGGGAGGGSGGSEHDAAGGVGGSIGASGGNGQVVITPWGNGCGGGGGGRVIPGTGGAARGPSFWSGDIYGGLGGGSGGSGGANWSEWDGWAWSGGGGGGWGAAGGFPGGAGTVYSGAGGSANAAGGNGSPIDTGYAYGAGGKAIALNGYSVTWLSGTAQVYGAVS